MQEVTRTKRNGTRLFAYARRGKINKISKTDLLRVSLFVVTRLYCTCVLSSLTETACKSVMAILVLTDCWSRNRQWKLQQMLRRDYEVSLMNQSMSQCQLGCIRCGRWNMRISQRSLLSNTQEEAISVELEVDGRIEIKCMWSDSVWGYVRNTLSR
jgi:hypothetical protein